MPTRSVSVETMQVGKKGGGKHWTKAEIAARKSAAEELQRKAKAKIQPPTWLNERAREIWDQVIEQAKELTLFDTLDQGMLAVYCDAVVHYEKCTRRQRKSTEAIKEQQSWARIIAQYANNLGLNPSARARLVKRAAEKKVDEFGKKFDG
jgi:phage terminase small subunit